MTVTTLQKLLVSSLERLGAAGLAYPGAKTVTDDTYMSLTELRNDFDMPEEYMVDCIVVWTAADGTLFPSAEERDAHDGVRPVETNEDFYQMPASSTMYCRSNAARYAQCREIKCAQCRLGPTKGCCRSQWDKAPYGMPLDKRIPWPKQP